MPSLSAGGIVTAIILLAAADPPPMQARYLRLGSAPPALECTFTWKESKSGPALDSVTGRGKTQLAVASRYDAAGLLVEAKATLQAGEVRKTVSVQVLDGKARVQREGQEPQIFEVPKGVIVTSAPDWTDTFLLCQRADPKRAGKQEFPGLWIHPDQPAQQLTFSIEKQGVDMVDHGGKKLDLHRHLIRLRNGSPYAAWSNEAGLMIKLVSLPYQEGKSIELALEGYEKAVASLKPPRE